MSDYTPETRVRISAVGWRLTDTGREQVQRQQTKEGDSERRDASSPPQGGNSQAD